MHATTHAVHEAVVVGTSNDDFATMMHDDREPQTTEQTHTKQTPRTHTNTHHTLYTATAAHHAPDVATETVAEAAVAGPGPGKAAGLSCETSGLRSTRPSCLRPGLQHDPR